MFPVFQTGFYCDRLRGALTGGSNNFNLPAGAVDNLLRIDANEVIIIISVLYTLNLLIISQLD